MSSFIIFTPQQLLLGEIKSKMRWARNVARMRAENFLQTLVGKREWSDHIGALSVELKLILKWMILREYKFEDVNWIHLAEDMIQ